MGEVDPSDNNARYTTGAEGIYIKAKYAIISQNTLMNAGLGEAAITIKGLERDEQPVHGSYGHSNQVIHNTIVYTDLDGRKYGRGIMTFTSDTLVSGNFIEGVEAGIRTAAVYGNFLVDGNILRDVCDHAIKVETRGRRVLVCNNQIHLADLGRTAKGIWLEVKNGAKDWLVHDNNIGSELTKGWGIYLKGYGMLVTALHVSRNNFSELQYGIFTKTNEIPAISTNGAWIARNYFRGCTHNIIGMLQNMSAQVKIESNLPCS